ncbi:MAG: DUF4252 domain-containing protein [Planctomycetota bacterium]|nr:DUF4252 domain-containing protein [Planctomycetota bacterium]
MHRLRYLVSMTLLIGFAMSLQGCIGFSGPNGIRKDIAKSQHIELEKEFGIDVGPLGFALANVIAAPFVPVTADGMWSASFGEYIIKPTDECSLDEFSLDAIAFDDWEQFIRVRDGTENIRVMHNVKGKKINKMLVLVQEGNSLMIARLEGNFEKVIDNLMDSDLFEDLFDDMDMFRDGEYQPEEQMEVQYAAADSVEVERSLKVKSGRRPAFSAAGAW